jgi:hypothetical protein
VDADGRRLGRVHDVRVVREGEAFRVVSVLFGAGALSTIATVWGYTEGRASGPWLLRRLLEPGVRKELLVSADDVAEWGETITLRGGAEPLHPRAAAG